MSSPALVPELGCQDVLKSLDFYTGILGFNIKYDRPEEGFYYLERQDAVIMIEQIDKTSWIAAPAVAPLGRGMHFEIGTDDLKSLYQTCQSNSASIFREWEEAWYRCDDHYAGQVQFIVQDPDGYLLRFVEDLGTLAEKPKTGRVVG